VTVRTWFTISAIVVIALFGAVALKLTAPVDAPSIVARVGEIRLQGQRIAACWPDGKKTKCTGRGAAPAPVTIPHHGTLRIVVAYPLQPKQGTIEVRDGSHAVFTHPWRENTTYDLPPGSYELLATARYKTNAHVEYRFALHVR
jgi:hypothetical protein